MPRLEDDPSHPRALLRPCILLLLAERPGHGYDLVERLRPLGFDWGGPGPLYQTLRRLEDAGSVVSAWDASDAGPARRTYQLTPEGRATLARWAESLDRLTTMLAEYRSRYQSLVALDAPGPGKHPPGPEPTPPSPSAAPRQRSGGRRVVPFGRRRGSSSVE